MAGSEFYQNLRKQVGQYAGPYGEYVLLLPDLFLLISRLMLDPRVETRHKAYLGAAIAYVVSPLDLLPERLLGAAGFLDDLAVLVAALNMMLNDVDRQLVLEHWTGSADLLQTIQSVLARADMLVGRSRLEKILESLGIRRPAGAGGTGPTMAG